MEKFSWVPQAVNFLFKNVRKGQVAAHKMRKMVHVQRACQWKLPVKDRWRSMQVSVIFRTFQEGEFPGFVPLIKEYLNDIDDVDIDTSCTILQYLNFISQRASGKR